MSTLDLPTAKDIFEFVKAHLLKQNATSSIDNGCLYRAGDLKCAVGCLITDEQYHPDLEGSLVGVTNGRAQRALAASLGRDLTSFEINMLRRMQDLHDHWDPEDWPRQLEQLQLQTFGEGN